jgi:hypothetical protein
MAISKIFGQNRLNDDLDVANESAPPCPKDRDISQWRLQHYWEWLAKKKAVYARVYGHPDVVYKAFMAEYGDDDAKPPEVKHEQEG